MKKGILIATGPLVAALLVNATTSFGSPGPSVDSTVAVTATPTGAASVRANPVAKKIALAFSIDLGQVSTLHTQSWGFGEIARALFYAQAAGVPANQVIALRTSGLGWGQIDNELGISQSGQHGNLGQIMSGRSISPTTETDDHRGRTPQARPSRTPEPEETETPEHQGTRTPEARESHTPDARETPSANRRDDQKADNNGQPSNPGRGNEDRDGSRPGRGRGN